MRFCEAEAMELTPEEIKHLEQLPDAANRVDPEVECMLEDGHTGAHVALGQSQDFEWDKQTNWWLRWTDAGGREWTHEPVCSAESGDDMCLLPTGHEGGHYWA